MNQEEAFNILGIKVSVINSNELQDAYEEAVFKECQFFNVREFIPLLAKARIAKLLSLGKAATALGFHSSAADKQKLLVPDLEMENLYVLTQSYHVCQSIIKLRLANTLLHNEAIACLEKWIEIFQKYAGNFCALIEKKHPDIKPDLTVRITEVVDYDSLHAELLTKTYGIQTKRQYSRLLKIHS